MLPLAIFIYVTGGLLIVHRQNDVTFSYRNAGTDLVFASSGGHWRAEEDLLRGRHFEQIVVAHELYKIQCGRSGAILIRTKPRKRPWNWAFWFDNYDEVKWRVPYMSTAGGEERESCAMRPSAAAEITAAEQAARQYLASLTAMPTLTEVTAPACLRHIRLIRPPRLYLAMRTHQIVAILWSGLNLFLATRIPIQAPFPWLGFACFALLPLLLIFFAERIAGGLHHGLMERFASDRYTPQSPLAIMLMGWIVLVLQSLLVVTPLV